MNTFQLECFLTVAETLNFAKAAQILNITQPAVTKQIKSLEDELNVRLFNRSTRSVELTSEGRLLINDAHIIIDTTRRAKSRFFSKTEFPRTLTIGLRIPIHIRLLYEPLNELLQKYDTCRPKLQVDNVSTLMRALYDEQIDVLLDIETKKANYESISFKRLFEEQIFCVCTDKFPIYGMENVTIEQIRELDEYPLLLMYAPKTLNEIVNAENAYVGNRSQSMVRFCSTPEEVVLLAELGCGIAVIPEMTVPKLPRLRQIPVINDEKLSFGIYYKTATRNEIVRSFIDIMKSHFSSIERPLFLR